MAGALFMNWDEVLGWARDQHQQGHLAEAESGYRRVLAQEPQNFVALHLLGVALHQQGHHDDAMVWINKALAIHPKSSEAWANHGTVCLARGVPDAALVSFDRSLRIAPDCADTISSRADALSSLGRFDEAIREYDRALALDASHINSWNNRGNSLQQAGRSEEAIESFNRALALNPQFVEAWNNFGTLLRRLERFDEALKCHAQAIAANPNNADSWNRQAAVMLDLHRYQDALQSSERALSLSPSYADACLNGGLAWLGIGNPGEALVCFENAVRLEPKLPEASYVCGAALQQLGRHEESIPALEQALLKDPHHKFALGMLATAALQLCDWGLAAELRGRLQNIESKSEVVPPLVMLGYFDEPPLLQQAARLGCPAPKRDIAGTFSVSDRSKMRIAYLSGDFCEHATAYLTAGLFESHDRSRFEVFGISYGLDDGTAMRRRLVGAFDRFFDVSERSDRDVACGLRELDVDIVIDLKGHTRGARTAILAYRPAPIQVNFLGYPGTMGTPYIDYIIGDATVLPHDEQLWYDEAIVHLPYCYQPQDSTFTAGMRPSREFLGLPQDAFVFCCFNNHWKLTEPVFAIWMDLLKSVDESVLWLLVDSASARERISRYTACKGVDPTRVIFADRVSHDEHLARHGTADLFLDTWPYGAHTTASDALRSHLPVITTNGQAFQGRVAASLLRALNLEELICRSADEYRAAATQLAREPTALRRVRQTLQANLSNGRLFNAASYCRYLEAAFVHMHKVRREGRKVEPFAVAHEHSISVRCNNVDI
jgi:protein O-GlcNAc transferase